METRDWRSTIDVPRPARRHDRSDCARSTCVQRAGSCNRRVGGCGLLSPAFLRSLSWGIRRLPCCAFAAVIVAQLLFGVRVVKRALFGADEASAARNPAVEWRLEPASARRIDPLASSVRPLGRWSLRGL